MYQQHPQGMKPAIAIEIGFKIEPEMAIAIKTVFVMALEIVNAIATVPQMVMVVQGLVMLETVIRSLK